MTKVKRHQERIWALQVLYGLDLTNTLEEEAARRRIDFFKEERLLTGSYYFEELVLGVVANKESLDQEIDQRAINWSLERIGYIERNILRIALFEIDQGLPIGVAINEAVELAKEYVDERSAGFINGILSKERD
ncbi:MAG TPA: transcription antitermination factor NusB [Halanaerobiaceae bacterium]|jgi:N utilization substance protein B|nr:transcription antitermination factor NusB [Bacillota bacterium]HHU92886.1 transcription antitermination factor NusB [Halanaerobiaceae bacterium]HOA41304.1 transcription antitermination factor NusB [Halanaerobiales bacterium]HPZ63508.1 transcription antitermination factor NusB [Halanaerobiales bacterium]HQD03951.1 transcription antitermination factor NusB [Halanaerobiales bacterium]